MKKKTKSNTLKKAPSKRKRRTFVHSNDSKGPEHGARTAKKKKRISLPSIKPWKIILSAITLGAMGMIYLSHIFATEQLLQEVQQLEQQYEQAKRVHSDYRLTYERMVGPAEIYEVAKQQDFINGGPAEKIIEVKE